MKDLKVLTVCGAGVGTSTLLRMNINDAFKAFNLPFGVKVENTENGTETENLFLNTILPP